MINNNKRLEILEMVKTGNLSEEEALQEIKYLMVNPQSKSGIDKKGDVSPTISSSDLILSSVKEDVAHIVSNILRLDKSEVGMHDEMGDFGFDSISYTEFADQVNSLYDIDVSAAIFFEYTSFGSFLNYIIHEYHEQIMKYYRESLTLSEVDVIVPGGQTPVAEKKKNRFSKKRGYFLKRIKQEPVGTTPVAIIGISGVLPRSPNLDIFWEYLREGKECITEIPAERWDWREYYGDPLKESNKTLVKWGAFIPDIDKFDARFFGISPHEAELMDPQQRLLLQTVWNTIEDAGYKPSSFSETNTGVFVGATTSDYNELLTAHNTEIKAHTGTGMFHAMLANRISFMLNLHGPSKPIDTACASSLVAVHRAIESIYAGQCDMAIAGGVNALLTPKLFISFDKAGMLSNEGRCKSFDASADGYVRGEGVGAILLKPLADAERDGDHIYAVIIGSAENHSGRSKSLTSPNPVAQANVIMEAYSKANIDPRTVSYIEAQGTGTQIGDTIEINGLKKAFTGLYEKWGLQMPDEPYCGIGTVKTNIGHLEIASGMAGIFKVVLSMKHKTLPGIRNFNKLNPGIKLKNSPFYIVDSTQEWKTIHDENGKLIPRRAGISAFGFGGSNSHIVLEEYLCKEPVNAAKSEPPYIMIVSAKEEESLKESVKNLYYYMKSCVSPREIEDEAAFLTSASYTLQVGREALEARLALVVWTREELLEKLEQFIQGKQSITGVITGFFDKKKNKNPGMFDEQDRMEIVQRTLKDKNYEKLIKLWIGGFDIPWEILYSSHEITPQRLSLPGYSFKKTRYWIPEVEDIRSLYSAATNTWQLHPLLMENVSTLQEQRFRSVFSGNEFFFRDHIVFKQKVMPGIASLEMLRAAGGLAAENRVTKLENVLWMNPVVMENQTMELFVGVYPDQKGIETEVYSMQGNEYKTHTKGIVSFSVPDDTVPATIDIDAILTRCTGRMDRNECYELFETIGLSYGPHFRGVREIAFNETEALSRIELTNELVKEMDQYGIHPALVDSALQGIIGLLQEKLLREKTPLVPFSVSSVHLIKNPDKVSFAYITYPKNSGTKKNIPSIFDIYITDTDGNVCIILERFAFAALNRNRLAPAKQSAMQTMFYTPQWKKSDNTSGNREDKGNVLVLDFDTEVSKEVSDLGSEAGIGDVFTVVPNGQVKKLDEEVYEINIAREADYATLLASLQEQKRFPRYIIHNLCYDLFIEDEKTLALQLERGIYSLLFLAKSLIASKLKAPVDLFYLYPGTEDNPQPQYEAVGGFFKTLAKENPKLRFKSIACGNLPGKTIAGYIKNEIGIANPDEKEVSYRQGERYVKTAAFINLDDCAGDSLTLKDDGAYLITGGLGGLGLIFAEHIASTCKAGIVLTGRSGLTPDKQAKLEALGSKVKYIQADVTAQYEVDALIGTIKKEFGELHGILHSAGIIRDNFTIKKTKEELDAVFGPKIFGTICLDEATKHENLDFIILFSSVSSAIGNVGQGDYAFANGFMDSFARRRNLMVKTNERSGKTIAVNWPLWQSGGMRPDEASTTFLYNTTGIIPLSTEKGLSAFAHLLRMNPDQIGVFVGDIVRFADQLKISPPEGAISVAAYEPVDLPEQKLTVTKRIVKKKKKKITYSKDLHLEVENTILKICGKILKIDSKEIDKESEFTDFGLDSILMIKLMNMVEEVFKETVEPNSVTLYPTVETFTRYLLDSGIVKQEGAALEDEYEEVEEVTEVKETAAFASNPKRRRFTGNYESRQTYRKIAVIGMACRMPESPDLESFWNNLVNGRDMISVVPADHWDWKKYYDGEDKNAPHKSYSKWGGFIKDVDLFDAQFFGIKDEMALVMDPQHRILLELTQELLDRSGYTKEEMSNTKTGIFIGATEGTYIRDKIKLFPPELMRYYIVNKIQNMMAARLSDFYNLKKTAFIIDTACSSSLVAIHEASHAIALGECDTAIVGGINLLICPYWHIGFSKSGALSDGPYSNVFDERANGFVLGEGAGLIMLKDFDKAVKDGDNIIGSIIGSAVNNDGHTMGLTTPDLEGQKVVIRKAIEASCISPDTISLFEAHGTGTLMGDPIEIKAATQVYSKFTQEKQFCAVGSVKSNIGHLLHAAGIAGVIKILLAMQHKQIPPTLNCEKPHPRFNLNNSPFIPVTRKQKWNPRKGVYRAAISSFGFGGTNCHMILEGFDPEKVDNYEQKRKELPLTKFKRKRYWLGEEITAADECEEINEIEMSDTVEQKENVAMDDEMYKELLTKLQNGELTPEELMTMEGEI